MPIFFFNSHNPKVIKFIIILQLGLSHLREHKFKHNIQGSLNLFCNCSVDIESTVHYLLYYFMNITERSTLLSAIANIGSWFTCWQFLAVIYLTQIKIKNVLIEYILSVKRFVEPIFQWSQEFFNQGYESINSVSTVIVTYFLLFVDFCSYFLRNFYLFRVTLIVLGTGWLSLLILQCLI